MEDKGMLILGALALLGMKPKPETQPKETTVTRKQIAPNVWIEEIKLPTGQKTAMGFIQKKTRITVGDIKLETTTPASLVEQTIEMNKQQAYQDAIKQLKQKQEKARQIHKIPKQEWDVILKKAAEEEHRREQIVRKAVQAGTAKITRKGAFTKITVDGYTVSGPAWLLRQLYGVK